MDSDHRSPRTGGLFSLPEYERAQVAFVFTAIQNLMERKDDLYARIPVQSAGESVHVTQNTFPSGLVVQNEPVRIEMKFLVRADDILSCNIGALAEQIDGAADHRLEVFMRHFFETNIRMCQAAETATDAAGQPFSFDLWLRGLERCPIRFDDEDEPIIPTMIVNPDMAKHISSLPTRTIEQNKAYDELIERKRREFHARQRHRALH